MDLKLKDFLKEKMVKKFGEGLNISEEQGLLVFRGASRPDAPIDPCVLIEIANDAQKEFNLDLDKFDLVPSIDKDVIYFGKSSDK